MSLPLISSISSARRSPVRRPRARALLLSAVLMLGMFAGLVGAASPASAASLPPRTDLENTISWAVEKLINTERALHGLAPLNMSTNLRLSARRHNTRMASWDEMSHQLPNEPWFGKRFNNAGYYWNWAGENIGWNSDISHSGVMLLERLMYNEKPPNDGHRLNILNSHYRNVGVDVYVDKIHHKIWLTTDFGHRS